MGLRWALAWPDRAWPVREGFLEEEATQAVCRWIDPQCMAKQVPPTAVDIYA